MSAAQIRADYALSLCEDGECVTLQRLGQNASEAIDLRARIMGFSPDELASGIDQGSRKIVLLAEDVEAAIDEGAWPEPSAGRTAIVKNDRIVVRGAPLNVESVDDSTRRVGGVLMAYDIVAKGF
ncbi:hypothetical protein [Methylopila sp. 73B]|uniref:hypothetical protein n=1 Tax=Methylopila sp. 73B TaxID=1120792 RepID=UPI000361E6C4|nr:hypothetical protein [Methylopila sp. 73B]